MWYVAQARGQTRLVIRRDWNGATDLAQLVAHVA